MKIIQLLEALEIPHAVFTTKEGLIGSDNYIVTDKKFRNILRPIDFVIHREGSSRYETNYLVRELSREELAEFKSMHTKYRIARQDKTGIVYERTRRPLKEYLRNK